MLIITNLWDFGGIWPFLYIFLIFFDFQFFFQKYGKIYIRQNDEFWLEFLIFSRSFHKILPSCTEKLGKCQKNIDFGRKSLNFDQKSAFFLKFGRFWKKNTTFFFSDRPWGRKSKKIIWNFFSPNPSPGVILPYLIKILGSNSFFCDLGAI